MFKFEKIIETAASKIIPVAINKSRCAKLRSRLSKCNRCIESCPVNGISIDKSEIKLNNNCIYCGLCASKCPNNAIYIQEPTERNLYKYVVELGEKGNTIVLTCSKNEESSDAAFKVPCLGSLSFEFIFGLDSLPFDVNVIFSEDKCKECEIKKGIDNYYDTLHRVRNLRDRLNMKINSIKHMEKTPVIKRNKDSTSDEVDDERREFIFSVFQYAKKLPNYAIKYFLGLDDGSKESKTIKQNPTAEKFSILRKELIKVDKAYSEIEIDEFPKPKLVNECRFCKACVILCPMGALEYEENGDDLNIILIKNACTGCGLCVEVCYYKSLKLESRNVNDFLSNSRDILISGKKRKCSICKKVFLSSEHIDACSDCLKKGKSSWR